MRRELDSLMMYANQNKFGLMLRKKVKSISQQPFRTLLEVSYNLQDTLIKLKSIKILNTLLI